jgi:hypothetical protein
MKRSLAFMILAVMLVSGCIPVVEQRCGLENCHGLDITCGPNVPEVCTEEYVLGDFCRQYATCGTVVDGKCQLIKSDRFDQCKSCVDVCAQLSGQEAFECEDECRQALSVPVRVAIGP